MPVPLACAATCTRVVHAGVVRSVDRALPLLPCGVGLARPKVPDSYTGLRVLLGTGRGTPGRGA